MGGCRKLNNEGLHNLHALPSKISMTVKYDELKRSVYR
jgi:hypothetical protein